MSYFDFCGFMTLQNSSPLTKPAELQNLIGENVDDNESSISRLLQNTMNAIRANF